MWEEAYNDAQADDERNNLLSVELVVSIKLDVTPTEISILTHFTHNSHSHR